VTPLGWVFAVSLTVTAVLWLLAIDALLRLQAVRRIPIIADRRLLEEHVHARLVDVSGACGHGLPGLVSRKDCECNGRSAL
jgi:hypothetical protein